MEIVYYLLGILLLGIGVFIIIEKPYSLAGILVFMMIYKFNLNVPGPLDARGLLLLILFVRVVIFDKTNLNVFREVLSKNSYYILTVIFILLIAAITYYYEPKLKEPVKLFMLYTISVLMGFYIINNEKGRKMFIAGIIAAGLLSVVDLVVHYWQFGGVSNSLNIFRPLDLFSTVQQEKTKYTNHNFPGLLSGLAFIYVYIIHKNKRWNRIITYSLLVVLLSGVFLSTSRSTILSLAVIIFIINFYSDESLIKIKNILVTIFIIIFFYSSFYFVYNIYFSKEKSKDNLANMIYYRLYDEPAEILGLSSKREFDEYSGKSREGSIKFRFEKASHDINKFFNKDLFVILFGYGYGGYKKIGQKIYLTDYNYSYVLEAHNGYVMLLVEAGLIGLVLFLYFSIGLSKNLIKNHQNNSLPIVYLFLGLAIYAIGQNSELTSTLSFLLIGGMIANLTENKESMEDQENLLSN